ncbi:MAG: ERAP1-like C-terminal domain-containing protein, partial [Planctomycetes bacterium]|nr:ERAP1-like C-terminal domain-containing protein [Planctomycetota bacterium]
RWWDDLWLNEAFATWMAAKAVDAWKPAYDQRMDLLQSRKIAMQTDSLSAARKVRQEVRTVGEANQAFDSLTYQKGALVLTMLERWVGEEAFRAGVRDYLRANEWGNATADDLWRAIDRASGRDVAGVARTFLETPGVPLVELSGEGNARTLRQSAYKLAGTAGPVEKGHRWKVPVRLSGADWSLLESESGLGPEGAASACHPNEGEWSYYRWAVDAKSLRHLAGASAPQDVRSRLGVLENAWGMVAAGRVTPDAYLETVQAMKAATERPLMEESILGPLRVYDLWEEEARLPGFAAFVRGLLGGHLARLGLRPRSGESEDDAIVRPQLLHVLGYTIREGAVMDDAATAAQAYLKDPASVPSDLAPIALGLAAREGRLSVADCRMLLGRARTPDERIAALRGLSMVPPANLKEALDLTLTKEFRAQDMLTVLRSALSRPEARAGAFAWFQSNYDGVRSRQSPHSFVHIGNLIGMCRARAERDAVRAFLEAHPVPGGDRAIKQGVERADHAISLRESGAASVRKFLS